MNLSAVFLAFYFVLISLVPCGDNNECAVILNQESSYTIISSNTLLANTHESDSQHSHSNSDAEDSDDYCSPFCTCACCGIAIVTINPFIPPAIFTKKKEVYFNYTFSNPIIDSYSVWQPPKRA